MLRYGGDNSTGTHVDELRTAVGPSGRRRTPLSIISRYTPEFATVMCRLHSVNADSKTNVCKKRADCMFEITNTEKILQA